MTTHGFRQVDVFTDGPFTGNPLAVIHDADNVDTAAMQVVTRWTNLSEAAFLQQPTDDRADYRVRIFEPKAELPFAGHPTLGACAAWLDAGGVPQRTDVIVQECGAGLVEIARDAAGRLAFAAPPMRRHGAVDADDLERALRVLGLQGDEVVASSWIDNGPGWMGLLLSSAERVRALEPPSESAHHFDVGVVGRYPEGHDAAVEVRAFFNDPDGSIREDPVTGSLNASIGQWLIGDGTLSSPYVARQTSGKVTVAQRSGSLWVGGTTDIRVSGTIEI